MAAQETAVANAAAARVVVLVGLRVDLQVTAGPSLVVVEVALCYYASAIVWQAWPCVHLRENGVWHTPTRTRQRL